MELFETLPASAQEFSAWAWPRIAPYYDGLLARPLDEATVGDWLADWTRLSALLDEVNTRFSIATTVNTADTTAEESYKTYLDEIVPLMGAAEQRLKQRLVTSGLEIAFWPYMAMVNALQHWIYEHPREAADIERCDDEWERLVDRYWPGLDWSGVEREKRAYWHRQSHVFTDPFYYIEYGIAQLGAVQVWANTLHDPAGAVAAYRRALALGATVPLPQLYAAAGTKFAFDTATLSNAVHLIEQTIEQLEPLAHG